MSSALDRKRLAKLLGMTGSDHDGEALNAVRAAERLIKSAGITWKEVLTPPPSPGSSSRSQPPSEAPRTARTRSESRDHLQKHAAAARQCLFFRRASFSEWELDFLENIQGFQRISPKQKEVLTGICLRAGVLWP